MPVINAQLVTAGQVPSTVGNNTSPAQQIPTILFLQTNDTLAKVLTTGYLNTSASITVFGDVYNDDQMCLVTTSDQGPVWLKIVLTTDNVSLVYPSTAEVNALTKSGTIIVGNILKVSNASGVMVDAGIAASALATYTGATVTGNLVQAGNATGEIEDAGVATANLVKTNAVNTLAAGASIVLPKVNGTEASNAVTANGVSGQITTSALTTAGGSTYSITWTNSAITATSSVSLQWAGGTNTTANFTTSIVCSAGSATMVIHNNTTATALNGTIIFDYTVS